MQLLKQRAHRTCRSADAAHRPGGEAAGSPMRHAGFWQAGSRLYAVIDKVNPAEHGLWPSACQVCIGLATMQCNPSHILPTMGKQSEPHVYRNGCSDSRRAGRCGSYMKKSSTTQGPADGALRAEYLREASRSKISATKAPTGRTPGPASSLHARPGLGID